MQQNNLHNKNQSKYLVCVNNNEHSRIAARFAYNKAAHSNKLVELLSVIEPADFSSILSVADKIYKEQRQDAEKMLQEFSEEVENWGDINLSLQIRNGRVSEEIMAAIEEDASINMVILGTSPNSPGRESLLPQLVSQLSSRLMIPMVIVPNNLTDYQIRELT
ncbi:MAG: universal stress protein [Pseudomonadota bacterium]